MTRFLLLSDSCEFVDVGHSLWRENGSAVYNCCWSSPAPSFLGLSSAELVTIFYCLRFETPLTCKARSLYLYPPGTGWPSYTPRHWVPFRRLLRLLGLWWRYLNPPPHGVLNFVPLITLQHRLNRKTALLLLHACILWPLPSNGCYLQGHCVATGLHATVRLMQTSE
jgi:hypothetical protein